MIKSEIAEFNAHRSNRIRYFDLAKPMQMRRKNSRNTAEAGAAIGGTSTG